MKTVIQLHNFSIRDLQLLRTRLRDNKGLHSPESPVVVEGSTFSVGTDSAKIVTVLDVDENRLKRVEGIVKDEVAQVLDENMTFLVICVRALRIESGKGRKSK